MEIFELFIITMTVCVTVSFGRLRLKKFCEAGDPTGAEYRLFSTASEIDCARACDVDTFCNFLSYHGNECAMYRDESACGKGVGATRLIHKVDPPCEAGWQRYRGRCYMIVIKEIGAVEMFTECVVAYDALPVAIRSKTESEFLTQLLQFKNMSAATVWLGGGYNPHMNIWHWASMEPMVYRNWATEEPITANVTVVICIMMNTADLTWQEEDCVQGHIGVCEKPLL